MCVCKEYEPDVGSSKEHKKVVYSSCCCCKTYSFSSFRKMKKKEESFCGSKNWTDSSFYFFSSFFRPALKIAEWRYDGMVLHGSWLFPYHHFHTHWGEKLLLLCLCCGIEKEEKHKRTGLIVRAQFHLLMRSSPFPFVCAHWS